MGLLDRFVASPQDRFARQVVAELHRNGIPVAQYLPDQFAIRYATAPDDDEGGQIFLHNVFAETRTAGREDRRARIKHLVLGVTRAAKPPDDWDSVRPTLRPVLRSTFFGRVGIDDPKPMLSRRALPHLNEYVVIDLPTTMNYVTLADVEKWGVGMAEVFTAARDNLARLAPVPGRGVDGRILKYLDTGDAYFTSMPLLDGWLAAHAPDGGGVVAFIPDRSSLLVLPDAPEVVAGWFASVEQEYRESSRAISAQAYTTDPVGRVVPYLGPEGHPVREAARRAEVIMSADEYAAQTELLSAQYEAAAVDIYVGKIIVAQPPDGPVFSVATWAQGIESLLPRAEYIAFVDSGQTPLRVRWEEVAAEVALPAEPGLEPPRFRVGHWPTPDVMDRLRTRAY